ncbi:MAG: hypothetical protein HC915_04675 [Anaerolineae bacterium]|nr:hypothetical protein [Anaerolineae bacterium]
MFLTTTIEIEMEQVPVEVGGEKLLLSLLALDGFLASDPNAFLDTLHSAAQSLAKHFWSQPAAHHQRSACMVLDLSSDLAGRSARELDAALDSFFVQARPHAVQTQKFMYALFQRPVFQVFALGNMDYERFCQRWMTLNRDANRPHCATTRAQAMSFGRELLTIAHRP